MPSAPMIEAAASTAALRRSFLVKVSFIKPPVMVSCTTSKVAGERCEFAENA
jgi:hypothetical protein